jgi:hypothetical protein
MSPSPVVVALAGSLVIYAAVALGVRQSWLSGFAAPVVAALLWHRHPRARFAAYVFFTVLAARGALTDVWALPAYALAAVGLMQTPAALRAWPRLAPGRGRRRGTRRR